MVCVCVPIGTVPGVRRRTNRNRPRTGARSERPERPDRVVVVIDPKLLRTEPDLLRAAQEARGETMPICR